MECTQENCKLKDIIGKVERCTAYHCPDRTTPGNDSDGHWVKDGDTIKCSKCGFGLFPSQPWFRNGECIAINNTAFRPKFCPECGAPMKDW